MHKQNSTCYSHWPHNNLHHQNDMLQCCCCHHKNHHQYIQKYHQPQCILSLTIIKSLDYLKLHVHLCQFRQSDHPTKNRTCMIMRTISSIELTCFNVVVVPITNTITNKSRNATIRNAQILQ